MGLERQWHRETGGVGQLFPQQYPQQPAVCRTCVAGAKAGRWKTIPAPHSPTAYLCLGAIYIYLLHTYININFFYYFAVTFVYKVALCLRGCVRLRVPQKTHPRSHLAYVYGSDFEIARPPRFFSHGVVNIIMTRQRKNNVAGGGEYFSILCQDQVNVFSVSQSCNNWATVGVAWRSLDVPQKEVRPKEIKTKYNFGSARYCF